jgi:hypothetical protein
MGNIIFKLNINLEELLLEKKEFNLDIHLLKPFVDNMSNLFQVKILQKILIIHYSVGIRRQKVMRSFFILLIKNRYRERIDVFVNRASDKN